MYATDKQCTDQKERKLIKICLCQEAEELKEYCQIVKTKIIGHVN